MNEDIATALKTARYNEVVVVNVSPSNEDEEEASREILLVACLDEVNGGIVWIDVASLPSSDASSQCRTSSPSSNDMISISRHLRTKRWVFPMFHDHRRNELYDQAIQAASRETIRRFVNIAEGENEASKFATTPATVPERIHVLDIGSGTGILAMMAARHLEQELQNASTITTPTTTLGVQVTSLEMSSAMARLAQLTVESNDMSQVVNVVEEHSCDFQQPNRAHLCTSELLESGLLGEGWIPALRDAWARHLHPNALVLPQRARVYAQIVEGDFISQCWGPHQWLDDFPEGRILRLCTSSSDRDVQLNTNGGGDVSSNLHATQGFHIPLHIKNLLQDGSIRVLSDKIQAIEIDLSSRDTIPGPLGQSKRQQFTAISSGRAQGVLFWWELDLWEKDHLTYSTEVDKEPWQDHWQQCLFVFSKPRDECVELCQGQSATLVASQDDSRLHFAIPDIATTEEPDAKRPCKTTQTSSLISPERAGQLNDLTRLRKLQRGIQIALSRHGTEAVVLDLSDFSLCAMIAGLQGAPNVTSLETSSGNIPITSARVAQMANCLPLATKGFQIVQCHPENLSLDILGGRPANVVLAEPYYELLEGWHLQEALNYFYLLRAFKKRNLILENAVAVPAYASVMGVAIQAPDLGRAYRLSDPVLRGFKHGVINKFGGRFSEYDLSLPMWQYDFTRLSEEVELARIDYEQNEIMKNRTVVTSSFHTAGTCHGMMIWIQYCIPDQNGKQAVLSSNDRPYNQIVRLLPKPIIIEEADMSFGAALCCRTTFGGLDGGEDHQFELKMVKNQVSSPI